jgi:hypothetical protein
MIPPELEELRPTRQATLELTAGLTQEQLDFSPAQGKWSIGEVMDHVPMVEASLRGEIEQLIELAEAGKRPVIRRSFKELDISVGPLPKSLLPFFEIPFTIASFFTPKAVTEYLAGARWLHFQNPESAEPRPGRPGDQLRQELRESVDATEELIRNHPDVDYPNCIHHHPLMGRNTVPDMLRFMVGHEERHRKQIQDVLDHPNFPNSGG